MPKKNIKIREYKVWSFNNKWIRLEPVVKDVVNVVLLVKNRTWLYRVLYLVRQIVVQVVPVVQMSIVKR